MSDRDLLRAHKRAAKKELRAAQVRKSDLIKATKNSHGETAAPTSKLRTRLSSAVLTPPARPIS